ncbi:MAG: MarC family protein [Deltaproteobacteria bacterium]|nr:MarC family protein [Deltaproteobacteria bacterium]
MSLLSATVLLFLVLDPFGNVPLFLILLKGLPEERKNRVIVREMLVALGVLIVFLFGGQYLIELLQISEPSLSIAGGIVLFLIAIHMIFGGYERVFASDKITEPFIVPLAIPSIAGPSAIATVLLLMAREPARWPEWLAAVLLAWFATGVIVLTSSRLHRLLGDRLLTALERLMGMLLTTVAVEMFIKGVQRLLAAQP